MTDFNEPCLKNTDLVTKRVKEYCMRIKGS